jgi:hypothetical protein
MYDLSDKVGTDISSLRVDATTHTSEHSNDGSTQSVSSQRLSQQDPVLGGWVVQLEDEHGTVEHEDTKTAKCETCVEKTKVEEDECRQTMLQGLTMFLDTER